MATGAPIPHYRSPFCRSRFAFCVYPAFSAARSRGFQWILRPHAEEARDSAPSRSMRATGVPGAAQHEVVRCRPGTAAVSGGPGSAMHHFAALALHRVRDTRYQRPDSSIPISRCQTAHLVPALALLRPGFASLLHSPPSRGGRSAERRWGAQRSTRGTRHDAACQAPSEAPCVP